jgi:hypothetical protein
MMSATAEIILLLLAAGIAGALVGLAAGHIAGTVGRRRRTRDNLRRRLIDTHQAIAVLENAVSGTQATETASDKGTKLSDRVAAARDPQAAEESERAGRS